MQITVSAFGIARDIIGGNELELTISNEESVGDVLGQLKTKFPDFEQLTSILLAVNESYAPLEQKIKEGDELVLIPPVSGG